MLRHPRQPEPVANEPGKGGEVDAGRRPPDRLVVFAGVGACRGQAEPAPTRPPAGKEPAWAAHQPLDHPNPTRERESISNHTARQQRTAEAQPTTRDREQAFDRLNPDYGVPADPHNPYGQRAAQDREAALSLGTRVSVATSRENGPNSIIWLAGQDYRAADATRTARLQYVRQRHGPERLGPER
jgi:hypothetical protein